MVQLLSNKRQLFCKTLGGKVKKLWSAYVVARGEAEGYTEDLRLLYFRPCIEMQSQREDYLGWEDYFMGTAFLAGMRSKDPSSQVGACVVDKNKRIIGVGYNGMPIGCSDVEFPWGKNPDSWLDSKYPYVCHAEMNAIVNKNPRVVSGCTIYTSLFPCNECAKFIIQSGIKEVVYVSDKHAHEDGTVASKKMLKAAGVQCRSITQGRVNVMMAVSEWNTLRHLVTATTTNRVARYSEKLSRNHLFTDM